MCQAKPGRRCSSHGSEQLIKAKDNFVSADRDFRNARSRLLAAKKIFEEFPGDVNRSTIQVLQERLEASQVKRDTAKGTKVEAQNLFFSTNLGLAELSGLADRHAGERKIVSRELVDSDGVAHIVPVTVDKAQEFTSLHGIAEDLSKWQAGAYRVLNDDGLTESEWAGRAFSLKAAVSQRVSLLENKKRFLGKAIPGLVSDWVSNPNDPDRLEKLSSVLRHYETVTRSLQYEQVKIKDIESVVKHKMIFKPKYNA